MTGAASLFVADKTSFLVNGSLRLAHEIRTWNCQKFSVSMARSKLGDEAARAANELISAGTGEMRSGRSVKRIRSSSSLRYRNSSAREGVDITCLHYFDFGAGVSLDLSRTFAGRYECPESCESTHEWANKAIKPSQSSKIMYRPAR